MWSEGNEDGGVVGMGRGGEEVREEKYRQLCWKRGGEVEERRQGGRTGARPALCCRRRIGSYFRGEEGEEVGRSGEERRPSPPRVPQLHARAIRVRHRMKPPRLLPEDVMPPLAGAERLEEASEPLLLTTLLPKEDGLRGGGAEEQRAARVVRLCLRKKGRRGEGRREGAR